MADKRNAASREVERRTVVPAPAEASALRRLQAFLIAPAVGLIWAPGGFFFHGTILLLLIAFITELVIQLRIESQQRTAPNASRKK